MKNFRFLLTAILAFSMFSCQEKSEGVDNGSKEKVYLSVNISVPTSKADLAPVPDGYRSEVGENSYIYIFDRVGNIVGSAIKFEPEDGSGMTVSTTSEADYVSFVGNFPAGMDPGSFSTKESLTTYVFNMAALAPDMYDPDEDPYGIKYATLYNLNDPTINKSNGEEWAVNITISPIVCRFEINEIAGNAELDAKLQEAGYKPITNCTFGGVYMNNIYQKMTITGTSSLLLKEDEISRTVSDWSCDILESIKSLEFIPEMGALAYHLAPANGSVPQIVIKLNEVTLAGGSKLKNLFITVNSYEDESGNTIEKFERGNVYQIEKISFNHGDLSTVIDPELIQLTVTVSVKGWAVNKLTPVI